MFLINLRTRLGIALLLVSFGVFAQSDSVGVSFLTDVFHPGYRQLDLTIWYPRDDNGPARAIGRNAVFLGAEGVVDAQPFAGQKPLILISHGGLRSATNSGAWFGQRLAKLGYVVVEVNEERAANPIDTLNSIGSRPRDMSRALDILLAHPFWSRFIDDGQIATLGFYLGGTASLMLSGVQFDERALRSSCDGEKQSPNCAWFAANGIGLSESHLKHIPDTIRDSRMASYIGIAPEYLHAFPVDTGEAEQANLAVLFLDKKNSASAEHSTGVYVDKANYFDGFGFCTPVGADIIAEEGGDPQLCGDSLLRQGVHDEIVERVLGILDDSNGQW